MRHPLGLRVASPSNLGDARPSGMRDARPAYLEEASPSGLGDGSPSPLVPVRRCVLGIRSLHRAGANMLQIMAEIIALIGAPAARGLGAASELQLARVILLQRARVLSLPPFEDASPSPLMHDTKIPTHPRSCSGKNELSFHLQGICAIVSAPRLSLSSGSSSPASFLSSLEPFGSGTT